jgi:hypothetical protein
MIGKTKAPFHSDADAASIGLAWAPPVRRAENEGVIT